MRTKHKAQVENKDMLTVRYDWQDYEMIFETYRPGADGTMTKVAECREPIKEQIARPLTAEQLAKERLVDV